MSLGEALGRLIRDLGSARGAALVGMDGIIVEEVQGDPGADLAGIGAECCELLKSVEQAATEQGLGAALELTASFESGDIVIRRVNPEYFVLLVIRPDGNYGKGRYLLRREAAAIQEDL